MFLKWGRFRWGARSRLVYQGYLWLSLSSRGGWLLKGKEGAAEGAAAPLSLLRQGSQVFAESPKVRSRRSM